MHAGAVDWHIYVADAAGEADRDQDFPNQPARSRQSALKVGRFFSGVDFEEHMYGPTADHSGCNVLGDVCGIHPTRDLCVMDAFCGWCAAAQVCISRYHEQNCSSGVLDVWDTEPYRNTKVEGVLRSTGGQLVPETNFNMCTLMVPGALLQPSFQDNTMLYHWLTQVWSGVMNSWTHALLGAAANGHEATTVVGVGREAALNARFLYHPKHMDTFFQYLWLLSPHCPLRSDRVPKGVCLVPELAGLGPPGVQSQAAAARSFALMNQVDIVIQRLKLDGVGAEPLFWQPPPAGGGGPAPAPRPAPGSRRPLVLLVQRLVKRFILNAAQLADATRALGADVAVVRLEVLPLYEQMLWLRRTDIIVAMHGSGLTNAHFMRRGTGMVEIMAYRVEDHNNGAPHGTSVGFGHLVGGFYRTLILPKEASIVHWRYKPEVQGEAARAAFLDRGPTNGVDFSTIFINQDVHVDVDRYTQLLREMLEQRVSAALRTQRG